MTSLLTQRESVVAVRDVSKSYGPVGTAVLALDGMSLDVKRGRVRLSRRCVRVRQEHVAEDRSPDSTSRREGSVDVHAKRTTLLFQDAALFPWLTAQKNVELAAAAAKACPSRTRRSAALRS